jgi:hypothetical protein
MVGTGTAADAVGGFIVAKGVASQVHGGHTPLVRHPSLWQRIRQQFTR